MSKILFVWHNRFTEFFFSPPQLWHVWTNRMKRLYKLLHDTGLADCCIEIIEAEKARIEEVLLVHDPEYVDLISKAGSKGIERIDYGDTYAYPGMINDLLLLLGGLKRLAELVLEGPIRIAYHPYAGLHHARPSSASGFCPINDVAIIIEYLRLLYNVKRVLYIDIDVHHADGVQDIYWDEPCVVSISFHGYAIGFYPGTGSSLEIGGKKALGTKINVPFPPGSCDNSFQEYFEHIVSTVFNIVKPDIIIAQLGVDGHKLDYIGILNLTTNTYYKVGLLLHKLATSNKTPLLALGGGGYGPRSAEASLAEITGLIGGFELLPSSVKQAVIEKIAEEETRCDKKPEIHDLDGILKLLEKNISNCQ